MMVLLSTIAVSQQFSGIELVLSVLKLIFFLTIWFVAGIFFIPTLLQKAKHILTDEMMLIISLALCLLMVIFASKVGFSPALGAFIMGSIIAETTQAEHIEHLVKPVKDLFGAVFFVSVGMLIDPNTLLEYALPVAILTLIVIFGQSISSTIGSLLSGQPLKQSIQAGMSLSQIGEFSFIIATLGMTLKVTHEFLYPIVVAVSAITTFTTPFMVKFAEPFSGYLENKLPKKWVKRIQLYSANTEEIKSKSNWQIVLKSYLVQIIIHSIIIIAIILLSSTYLLPLVQGSISGNSIAALITLIILSPFLWALSLRRVAIEQIDQLMEQKKHQGPIVMLVLFRIGLTLFYIGFILNTFFSTEIAFFVFVIALATYIIFPKKLHTIYNKIELHFMSNLNNREKIKDNKRQNTLSPWDGHMAEFEITKESNLAGKTLEELQIREQFGINIVTIKRGEILINIPLRTERLFPGDELNIVGTDIQVKEFKIYLEKNEIEVAEQKEQTDIILQKIELKNRICIGKSIRESNIREKTHGIIVGIERNGNRILNPESHLILEESDILWIAGEKKKIAEFLNV
jgi:CPA2 family monovalent cation:H+ antiporter-2